MSDRTPADTRDLADRLRLIANEMTYGRTASTHSDACWQWHESCALHRAADLLDGQPQDRPAQCPTCGSDDPDVRLAVKRPEVRIEGGARVCRFCNRTLTFNFMRNDGGDCDCTRAVEDAACPDSWHVGGSGDTR